MIKVLDCTLRDGGYINEWKFRKNHIISILGHLTDSKLDFIECGYLSNKNSYDENQTIFSTLNDIQAVLPKDKSNSKYVAMINYGEYENEHIPPFDSSISIVGFRIVFHKKDWKSALKYCEELNQKGYLVFVQPMMTINYSDYELLELIEAINRFNPFACYIVDSFGVMKRNDLLRLSYIFDHNLNSNIQMGYHAHNNLQLAYSNAQVFCELATTRKRIVDGSVYGMGRGAGNLNTELFVQYLNDNHNTEYNINPLLKIIDESLSAIYETKYWGYSMPHYLSAIYQCHPNYASYLSEKNTLTVDDLKKVIEMIDVTQKDSFNRLYVEHLYKEYQQLRIDDTNTLQHLKELLVGRTILLVGPGTSVIGSKSEIQNFIYNQRPVCISVNHKNPVIDTQYTFISNLKRFEQLSNQIPNEKLIITSNIENEAGYKVNYENLTIENDVVGDNSLLLALQLLKKLEIKNVILVGFDGYGIDSESNYADIDMMLPMRREHLNNLNEEMIFELNNFKEINISFLTSSLYESELKYSLQK